MRALFCINLSSAPTDSIGHVVMVTPNQQFNVTVYHISNVSIVIYNNYSPKWRWLVVDILPNCKAVR